MNPSPPAFPPPNRPGIKICGLTSPVQMDPIVAAGADAIGINLWPQSKRHLPLAQAAPWLPAWRDRVFLVAVVVNPSPQLLSEILDSALFHAIQLHGDETPDATAALMTRGARVIKALQVRDEASLDAINAYPCPDILLDASNPGTYGGGGVPFPWHLAARARERFPDKRLILSGGLRPDNVAQAITEALPDAVDVASGVESAPGIKDLAKVRAFIANARPR